MTKDYLKKHAQFLGQGSTREIYKLNNDVYKVASYPENEGNNKTEIQRYKAIPEKLKKYVPKLEITSADNFQIIRAEYIKPLEEWVIEKNYMTKNAFLDACMYGEEADDLCERLNLGLYFPYELVDFMRKLGSAEGELYYPANYGVKNDTLILLDFADGNTTTGENSTLSVMRLF